MRDAQWTTELLLIIFVLAFGVKVRNMMTSFHSMMTTGDAAVSETKEYDERCSASSCTVNTFAALLLPIQSESWLGPRLSCVANSCLYDVVSN